MSKPTAERLERHEAKRANERKLQRIMSSQDWEKRKIEIKARVLKEEKASKTKVR